MLSISKTNIIFSITIVILLLLVQNCNNPVESIDEGCKDTAFIPLKTDGLIPLKVGNYWEYKIQTFDGGDTANPLFINYSAHEITKSHYTLHDCNLYETVVFDYGTGGPSKWLMWQDSTGFYNMGGISDDDSLIDRSLLFKYPVEKGESWKYRDLFLKHSTQKFELGDSIVATCVSTNKIFATPAGKFSCYVYYWRKNVAPDVTGFYDTYDYINPSIGIVGQEVFTTIEEPSDTVSVLTKKVQLNNYNLK